MPLANYSLTRNVKFFHRMKYANSIYIPPAKKKNKNKNLKL